MPSSTDIFGRTENNFGGSLLADKVRLVFAAGGGQVAATGLLTQNLQLNYSQQISRLWEVGQDRTFYVAGRSQGNLSLARVLGPQILVTAFYSAFGNPCNAAQNTVAIDAQPGDCDSDNSNGLNFMMKHCIISNIGANIAAADMVLNEQVQMMFTSLAA